MRTFHLLDRMRCTLYPQGRLSDGRNGLYASDVILGMLAVMLAVLFIAYVITFAFSL